MAYRSEGEKKCKSRNGGNDNQDNVDGPMQALAAAAMSTEAEVIFVVAAHLRSDPRDVIAPSRENIANNLVHTLIGHYRRIDSIGSDCEASITRFPSNLPRGARARSAVSRAISGWLLHSERCAKTRNAAPPS